MINQKTNTQPVELETDNSSGRYLQTMVSQRSAEMLIEMREWAEKECDCTEDQQAGEDYTECKSCRASRALNDVAEEIHNQYEYFIG